MAKAIYALKVAMFKSQFNLTAREEEGLLQVCLFVVLLYVKAWFTAPSAPAAPFHDLTFLQKLVAFETVNKKTSELAVKKFCGHLWYLGEELVPMSLFDPAVPTLLKQKIVAAMDDEGDAEQTRRILLKP